MKIGILGGGQLARMLALAAYPLNIRTVCLDPKADACAKDVTEVIHADYTDKKILQQIANDVDVFTLENENIESEIATWLTETSTLSPPVDILRAAQDRLVEKNCFCELDIPTVEYTDITTLADLKKASATFPALLKTRRFGYDGKGQSLIRSAVDCERAWAQYSSHPLILEQFLPFDYEVSIIAVRNAAGEQAFYPLTHKTHKAGILRVSRAPFIHPELQKMAEDYAARVLTKFNYIGVLTIEFFVKDNMLYANEMAPRVHNSGHWTIEGASTSQFENHIRAVAGLPLGNTDAIGYSVMVNCIGEMPAQASMLKIPNAHYHDYNKAAREGRKVGHVTVHTLKEEDATVTLMNQFLSR